MMSWLLVFGGSGAKESLQVQHFPAFRRQPNLIMEQTSTSQPDGLLDYTALTSGEVDHEVNYGLYNDLHFGRTTRLPLGHVWAPFPRLPTELRLCIWRLFLCRHRMIEVGIWPNADQNGTHDPDNLPDPGEAEPRPYTARNLLGNLVSGPSYALVLRRQRFATTLNPLLWVSSEARQAALGCYRVHLPCPGLRGERLLYLNPEYDVVYVCPERSGAPLLVDFLCDVRAYDPKDRGYVILRLEACPCSLPPFACLSLSYFHTVCTHANGKRIANLALGRDYRQCLFGNRYISLRDWAWEANNENVLFDPAMLHPVAAASFANMLQTKLRSVLCVVNLRDSRRGAPEEPFSSGMRYHFCQTIPLRRGGPPMGALDWLEADPRPGVEFDLRQLSLGHDPRALARCWERLEKAFGLGAWAKGDDFRLYICPTIHWSQPSRFPVYQAPNGSRAELAGYLDDEAHDWLRKRRFAEKLVGKIPRHGTLVDAETFERWERTPTTAVGMWLFPPEAFKEPKKVEKNLFDVSAVRPGLLLIEVGED